MCCPDIELIPKLRVSGPLLVYITDADPYIFYTIIVIPLYAYYYTDIFYFNICVNIYFNIFNLLY